MIAELVPRVVVTEELFADPPDVVLFDAERAAVARAVEKRRREFGTVRHCARRALGALGHPPVPLLPGEGGAPQWPAGVVGSMTHCAGYRAAAVARSSQVCTVGIDAEPHDVLPDGVLSSIMLPAERTHLAELSATDRSICWDRLLFSCKEAVYKAWFPLTRRWLGFEEASVTLDPVRHTFSAHVLVPGPSVHGAQLQAFHGRWSVYDGLILAAITVLADPGIT
jgi:4'-phosphopantetheinyl transferase EntD